MILTCVPHGPSTVPITNVKPGQWFVIPDRNADATNNFDGKLYLLIEQGLAGCWCMAFKAFENAKTFDGFSVVVSNTFSVNIVDITHATYKLR